MSEEGAAVAFPEARDLQESAGRPYGCQQFAAGRGDYAAVSRFLKNGLIGRLVQAIKNVFDKVHQSYFSICIMGASSQCQDCSQESIHFCLQLRAYVSQTANDDGTLHCGQLVYPKY